MSTRHKILILGGGFGGMYAALQLDRALARRSDIEVTLVNKENFFLFTPMLHEVAASDLDMTHIVNPIRKMLSRVQFFEGHVESIDLQARKVLVAHGTDHHHHTLDYDHLVLSLGTVTNFFALPGVEERALTMKSLGDAIYLRNLLIDHLEEADFECCADRREPLLSVVVAGGGFSGVETVAAINDFMREALRFYPRLDESQLRLVLVHPGSVILPELGPDLGAYAQKKLAARGVEIHTGKRVKLVDGRVVVLDDGTVIPAETLIWTAGTAPNPMLSQLPCGRERGRLIVEPTLEVAGWPGVWAVGDCGHIVDSETGAPYPPTAQHALREGRVAATNILADIDHLPKKPFRYRTLGQLAAIGRRAGVARVLGLRFSGFLAWWLWRTIYWSKLPSWEKKLRVAFDWTLDLAFTKDLVQFATLRTTEHVSESPAPVAEVAVAEAVATELR